MAKTKKYLPSGIRSQLSTQKSVILNKNLSKKFNLPKKRTKVICQNYKILGTRLYGTTTLAWPILLWPLLTLPILLLVHFGMDLSGANFMKTNFFFCFLFQFFN